MLQYIHCVFWGNPYTQPPAGLPRCLFTVQNSDRRPTGRLQRKIDRIIDRCYQRGEYTWSQGWTHLEDLNKVKRQWSDERKFANRLRRLKIRVARKFTIPELYEAELARCVAMKPEYFGVVNSKE